MSPNIGRVKYDSVYPGIDQIFHGNEGNLQYDFVIAPGTDPAAIGINYAGADGISIDEDGSLVIDVGGQTIVQTAACCLSRISDGARAGQQPLCVSGGNASRFEVGAVRHDARADDRSDADVSDVCRAAPARTRALGLPATVTGISTLPVSRFGRDGDVWDDDRSRHDAQRQRYLRHEAQSHGHGCDLVHDSGGTGDDRAYGIAVRATARRTSRA